MKKAIVCVLILSFVCLAACSRAEQTESFFARFEGFQWEFSGSTGSWYTRMLIYPDGSFSGDYSESKPEDTGKGYEKDGTICNAFFSGRLSLLEQLDENTWKIRVTKLSVMDLGVKEYINDGIRRVFTDPYGLREGDEMLLFRPGASLDCFSDEMLTWAPLQMIVSGETSVQILKDWYLWNETSASGFMGYQK